MYGDSVLLWICVLPIIGSAIAMCAQKLLFDVSPTSAERTAKGMFIGTLAVVCGLSVWLAVLHANGADFALAIPHVCGMGLTFTLDGFRVLYLVITSVAWLVSGVFFLWYAEGEEHQLRYFVATLVTLGCTLGVLLSADLFTTFVFFEGMSLASFVWVIQEQTKAAIRAAKTYLAVAVIGGLVLLMGLFLLYRSVGTLSIDGLALACRGVSDRTVLYAAGACLLFGFGAKAGAWPLHVWLPEAHPEAPAPASSLLSGILTKTGIFGILILSGRIFAWDAAWGKWIVAIGVITMLAGAIPALASIDIKHMLACSSVSQIGFILSGAGAMCVLREEQGLATSGAILHMLNHSSFKLILFLCAGILVKNLHTRDFNRIRGFGRGKYALLALMGTASLGIAGIPGTSGYVSKTLLHEALAECAEMTGSGFYHAAEILFLIAGGCTFAYMAKLMIVLFVRKPSIEVKKYNLTAERGYFPKIAFVMLGVVAAGIFVGGCIPGLTLFPMAEKASSIVVYPPLEETVELLSWKCLSGSLISVSIGIALLVLVVRPLVSRKRVPVKETPEYVDRLASAPALCDDVYRPLLLNVFPAVGGALMTGLEQFTEVFARAVFKIVKSILACLDKIVDALMLLLRRTALRPVCEQQNSTLAEAVCNSIGTVGNGALRLWNCTFGRRKPKEGDCRAAVNRARINMTESVKLVSRSLSYGLIAFCIGLMVLLVYILLNLNG